MTPWLIFAVAAEPDGGPVTRAPIVLAGALRPAAR